MIEFLMYGALGFLGATLLALLVLPALNRRAERLARRRVEALFPLSIEELNAEKDHLRAEFAVLQRRLERQAEEGFAARQDAQEQLGRRAVRIETLTTDLGQRDDRIRTLEADLADTRTKLAGTEADLQGTRQTLQATRDTLSAIEAAHRRTLDELGSTRGALETMTARHNEARTQWETTRDRLAVRESEFADFLRRYNETLTELDARRIALSDLETRLAVQTAKAGEAERQREEARAVLARRDEVAEADTVAIRAENEALRRRIDEVADQIMQASPARPAAAE